MVLKWSDLDLTYGKLQVQRTLIRVSGGQAIVAEPKTATSRRCIHVTQRAIETLARHQQKQHLLWKKRTTSKRRPERVFCDAQGIPFRAANMVRQSFQPLLANGKRTQKKFFLVFDHLAIEEALGQRGSERHLNDQSYQRFKGRQYRERIVK